MKVTYQSVFTRCQDGNSENNQTYLLSQTCHLVGRTGHILLLIKTQQRHENAIKMPLLGLVIKPRVCYNGHKYQLGTQQH